MSRPLRTWWRLRWRSATGCLVAGIGTVVLAPAAASAHGLGGRADLPVPVGYFAAGAGVVVVVSFVMVSALWTSPRLQGTEIDTEATPQPNRLGSVLRIVGLVLFSLVVITGLADGTASALNVTPVLVLVGFWLVVPFLAPLVGDWWRWLSPWGLLSRHLNASVVERPDLVDRFGVLPATLSLFAFTWLELVSPDSSDPRTPAVAALVLTVVIVAAGRLAGPESGLRLVDGFHTWFGMLGAIAPRDATITGGRPRGWFRTLAAMPSWRGLSLLLVVMIGSVTYDGMSGTDWWIGLTGGLRNEMWFQTAALAGWVAVIGIAYLVASWFSATVAGGTRVATVADRFAHTLVPIALAYAVAHYLTLVLFEGQILIAAASDPFGLGWDLFDTAERRIAFWVSPEVVWYLQVATIVSGHVAGVVLSHDRALHDFGEATAVRTQHAMLVLMVALTSLGLFILAG